MAPLIYKKGYFTLTMVKNSDKVKITFKVTCWDAWNKMTKTEQAEAFIVLHTITSTRSKNTTFTFLEGNHYTTQESVQYYFALNLNLKGITTLDESIFNIPNIGNCSIINLSNNYIDDVDATIMSRFTYMNVNTLNLAFNPLRNLTSKAISEFMGDSLILTGTYVSSKVYDDLKGTWQNATITWPANMK